jgi:hypothetical protein
MSLAIALAMNGIRGIKELFFKFLWKLEFDEIPLDQFLNNCALF